MIKRNLRNIKIRGEYLRDGGHQAGLDAIGMYIVRSLNFAQDKMANQIVETSSRLLTLPGADGLPVGERTNLFSMFSTDQIKGFFSNSNRKTDRETVR